MTLQRFINAVYADWHVLLVVSIVCAAVFNLPFKLIIGGAYSKFIDFIHRGRFGLGGSARFVSLIEEWIFHDPPKQTLFMGRSLYNPFLYVTMKDDRHMFTIAGSRTGKGATCIIPNLLEWEGSVLVIDPKGTNALVTASYRKQMGQTVHIVDPFGIVTTEGARLNPLEHLDPDSKTIREDIAVIAEALAVPEKHAKDPHWDDGARSAIAGFIGHALTTETKPTLSAIRKYLTLGTKEQAELYVAMRHNPGAGGAPRDAAARIIRGVQTDEIKNILSNVDKHTEWLGYESMKHALQSSTFKFSELKEKPTTVYLVLPPEYLEVHKRFLRMFVNLAINEMPKGGRSKIPVLMILDEFQQLGKMEQVQRAFRLLGGYNFVVWPFAQDWGGIKEMYDDSSSAFVTNSRGIQTFGVSDEKSLELIVKQIGQRSLQYVRSVENPIRQTPLRTADEAAIEVSRDSGMQYILRAGNRTGARCLDLRRKWRRWRRRRFWPSRGRVSPA